ncbi:MAG: sodium:solute symporter [Candidatus Methylacidiphilales bacterium]
MDGVETHFTWMDWAVVVGYMALTTWVGHRLRGRQATIRDFFLAGRRLPWPAVAGSIIATEISALTFIGVPGMVWAATGNFTYLQWAIGSVLARVLIGVFLVKKYYEEEIYSPYDYMERRLGVGVKRVTTLLFFLGAILGQSVRLLVPAIVLRTVTGLDFQVCILLIGIFAVGWTWMGGMATVIWTDVMQFFLFLFGGILALVWIVGSLDGGWNALVAAGVEGKKWTLWNLTTDPAVEFTLWVALLAMPFQNLAAFGMDQLNAQRMFCCRNAAEASKAIIWSSLSQVVTVLMMLVGVGLYAFYGQHPPTEAEGALFLRDKDYVFPVWITTVLPVGVSGLVLAGAFAAAISSMDSILAALAQTTMSLMGKKEWEPKRALLVSRGLVLGWAVVLVGAAMGLDAIRGNLNLVPLAFGMVAYTYGPMLGILFLALTPIRVKMAGIWLGLILSIGLTLWVRPDVYNLLVNYGALTPEQVLEIKPKITFAWLYPITCLVTVGCGLLGAERKEGT